MSKSFGVLGGTCLVLLLGCGDETKPHPGYADPCATPMAGALGCPITGSAPGSRSLTIDEACRKLTSCGILAGELLTDSGTACGSSKECTVPGGECLPNSQGASRCHNPTLDFQWCVTRLSLARIPGWTPTDPCDSNQSFSIEHVQATLACITTSQCGSLGASFADKRLPRAQRPEIDKYLCKDGKRARWTATICDFGLLAYDYQDP
jgi:hypothetical protein